MQFSYNQTVKTGSELSETMVGILEENMDKLEDFDVVSVKIGKAIIMTSFLRCILFTNDAVELDSAYMTLKDQTKATGTDKILIGTVAGFLGLIALAGVIVATLVIVRKRTPRNYEKVPLLVDRFVCDIVSTLVVL